MSLDKNKGVCITCRHLIVDESGREFEKIIDTEYLKFRCEVFGQTRKEYYLMAPVSEDISVPEPNLCEFWEFWQNN